MAVVKCSECGKDVSGTAQVCPNCGYQLIAPRTTRFCAKKKCSADGVAKQPNKKHYSQG